MRGSRTQRAMPVIAQPIRVEVEDEEVIKGAAKSRMHKRSSGKKRSPAKVRTVTAGMRQNPSAAKRSKKKRTTRPRFYAG